MNTGALTFFANYIPSNFNNKLSCFFNFEDEIQNNILSPKLGKDKTIVSGVLFNNIDVPTYYYPVKNITGVNMDTTWRNCNISQDKNICIFGPDKINNINVPNTVYIYTGNGSINNWDLKQVITGGNNGNDHFGVGMASNSDCSILVIGAPYYNDNNTVVGTSFIYTGNAINGWTLKQVLTGDNTSSTRFGENIACTENGSIIIIGQPNLLNNIGGAAIYTGNANDGWNFKQLITGRSVSSRYGYRVGINHSGSVLMMSSFEDGAPINRYGGILIYTGNANDGWNLKQFVSGNINITNNGLGWSIKTNKNNSVLMFGERLGNKLLIYTGDTSNGWNLKQALSGLSNSVGFGWNNGFDIDENNNTIVVGSFISNTNTGNLHIYTGNLIDGWKLKDFVKYNTEYPIGSLKLTNDAKTLITPSVNGITIYNLEPLRKELKSNNIFISGDYIKIDNLKNSSFNFKNFTYLASIEKLNSDGGVLLSSLKKDTGIFLSLNNEYVNKEYYKGFEFGVTANNYLYFEYFKNDGPVIFVSNNKINDKAVVYLSVVNNNINYGYANFKNSNLVNENNNIISDYLFDQDNFYIGYNPENNLYSNNKKFIGYFEDIIFTSPAAFNYEITNIISGFVYDFNYANSYTGYKIFTGVTGSYFGITGYQTQITGWEKIATGNVTNLWGITVMGYLNSPLTKQVPLSGIFNLTGTVIDIFTGYSGVKFNLNNEKFLNYENNVINFLYDFDKENYVKLRFITGYNSDVFNKKNIKLKYNRISDLYTNFDFKGTNYNLFANGQLQISGKILKVNDPYAKNSSTLIINNDYGFTGDNVIFNNFYGLANQSFIEAETINKNNIYLNNLEEYLGIENSGFDLFLNGQQIEKNIHFNIKSGWEITQKLRLFPSSPSKDFNIIIDYEKNIYSGNQNDGWVQKHNISSNIANDIRSYSFYINNNKNLIFFGCPFYLRNNSQMGAIIVYSGDIINGWSNYKIITGETRNFAQLGGKMSINEDGSIFAATFNGTNQELHIYTGNYENGWSLKSKLPSNQVGSYSNWLHIKDNGKLICRSSNGIFIYTGNANDGWNLRQVLTGTSSDQYLGFDFDLTDNGSVIVAGDFGQSKFFIYTGNANNGWNLRQQINTSSLSENRFGVKTALSRDASTIYILGVSGEYLLDYFYTGNIVDGWNLSQKSINRLLDNSFPGILQPWVFNDSGNLLLSDSNVNSLIYFKYNNKTINLNNFLNKDFSAKSEINIQDYSGILVAVNSNFDIEYVKSGTESPIFSFKNNFYSNNTEIYVNGLKQSLNNDYLELSKYDITTGVKIMLENNNDYIYNNEGFIR
jgi:hypothetical protein